MDQTSPEYSDELATLRQRGVLVVAASGNDGVVEPFGIEYPAADPSVFSVGAVDQFDRITEYTARAANLDYLAAGDDVATVSAGPNDFETVSGTSFASPEVAGTVALMKEVNPGLRVGDEQSILRAGGVDNLDGDSEFGTVTHLTFPRLDVASAVKLAGSRLPTSLSMAGQIGAGV